MAESNPSNQSRRQHSPNTQQKVASKRLQQAQAQVGEVVDIMRVNVEKLLERDQILSDLDRRADDLLEGASQFQQQTVKLKRKFWWKNYKMMAILGAILLVIILIFGISLTGGGMVHMMTSPSDKVERGITAIAGAAQSNERGSPESANLRPPQLPQKMTASSSREDAYSSHGGGSVGENGPPTGTGSPSQPSARK